LGALALVAVFPAPSPAHRTAARSASPTTSSSTTTSTTTTLPTTTVLTTTAPPTPTPVAVASGLAAPIYARIPTSDPVVFFTIDDGIVQDPAVVDYLRDQHLPVTIFPVPNFVHQNPAYFQAIHALGASVQDHTLTHPDLRRLSPAAQQ